MTSAKILGAFLLSLIAQGADAEPVVPNEFQAGQPARAAEVNENFAVLGEAIGAISSAAEERAQGIEQRVSKNEGDIGELWKATAVLAPPPEVFVTVMPNSDSLASTVVVEVESGIELDTIEVLVVSAQFSRRPEGHPATEEEKVFEYQSPLIYLRPGVHSFRFGIDVAAFNDSRPGEIFVLARSSSGQSKKLIVEVPPFDSAFNSGRYLSVAPPSLDIALWGQACDGPEPNPENLNAEIDLNVRPAGFDLNQLVASVSARYVGADSGGDIFDVPASNQSSIAQDPDFQLSSSRSGPDGSFQSFRRISVEQVSASEIRLTVDMMCVVNGEEQAPYSEVIQAALSP